MRKYSFNQVFDQQWYMPDKRGIVSFNYFNVHMDGLSQMLNNSKQDCGINDHDH